jgi:hypothetical protein
MRKSFAVLLLVLVSSVAACSSDSGEQIQGIWSVPDLGVWLQFDEGDQFRVAQNSDVEAPVETGTYTFDGETLTRVNSSSSSACPDTEVTFTVVFSADGDEADLTFVEDSCPDAHRSIDQTLIRQSS